MIYVGTYALIYPYTILGQGIVSRDTLPRGFLPSGILKMENIVQASLNQVWKSYLCELKTKRENLMCLNPTKMWYPYICSDNLTD